MLPKDCPKIAQSTLEAIIQDPYITIGQLSEVLKLSERTIKNRIVGDFRFILIQEQLSQESKLNFWESTILKLNLFIKKFTVSPSKWFGLDTSDVYIEKVPLFLGHSNPTILTRKYPLNKRTSKV